MTSRVSRLGFRLVGRVPEQWRQRAVRVVMPKFTVGCTCLVEHEGRVLLVRPAYRPRWGLPGGLLHRGETPVEGVRRELREELVLDVVLDGRPIVVLDIALQRIDLVFRARLVEGATGAAAEIASAELSEIGWFESDSLPELQHECRDALAAFADLDAGGPALRIASPRH